MKDACGKIILFGEHAVVYGHAGIAIPVKKIKTSAEVEMADCFSYESDKELIEKEKEKLEDLFDYLFLVFDFEKKDKRIIIESNIPIGSGLGSSASLSVALIRAFSDFERKERGKEEINKIAYECEKIFHGTPSGIDNTVVVYEEAIYYEDGKIEVIKPGKKLKFLIVDTGIKADTKEIVNFVKKNFEKDNKRYKEIFSKIAGITEKARVKFEEGNVKRLGVLMTRNHDLLKEMGVSIKELDMIVEIAIENGAYGAKMAGAGKGGCVVVLVDEENKEKVEKALKDLSKKIYFTELR